MSEEDRSKMTPEEFKEKFPPGTRIEYGGEEFVVHHHKDDANDPYLVGFNLSAALNGEMHFTLSEWQGQEFDLDDAPEVKIPRRTEYPPQVFVLSWLDADGRPTSKVFKDLGALKAHGAVSGIPGDAIMEAISDPGEPIHFDGQRTLVLSAIEG